MSPDAMIFLDPPTVDLNADRFVTSTPESDPDAQWLAYSKVASLLAAQGLEVHTADRLLDGTCRAARNLYYSFGPLEHLADLKAMPDVELQGYFLRESRVARPQPYRMLEAIARDFARLYAFNAVGDGYDLPGPQTRSKMRSFRLPAPFEGVLEELWANTERQGIVLANLPAGDGELGGDLYRERLRAAAHFGPKGKLDLYGAEWLDSLASHFTPEKRQHAGWPLSLARTVQRGFLSRYSRDRKQLLTAYKGPLVEKRRTLSRYRFAICYENAVMKGYVGEGLFDALYSGTIPIYLGAPDIIDWVPASCFIDKRNFRSYDDLERHLDALSPEALEGYREAGRAFLTSARFAPFSPKALADVILEDVVGERD